MTEGNDNMRVSGEAIAEALLPLMQSMQAVTDKASAEDRTVIEAFVTSLTKIMQWIVDDSNALRADVDAANARALAAERALKGLLDRYTTLINSGDCGNWNVEEEDEVIAARAVLPVTVVHKTHDVSVDGHWFPLTPTDSDVITVTTVTDGSAEE